MKCLSTDSESKIVRVGDSNELNNAIEQANELGSDETLTIILNKDDVKLTEDIATINTAGTLIILNLKDGNSATVDGQKKYRGFVVLSGRVTIRGLCIISTLANGKSSCLGAGAGLFVANVEDAWILDSHNKRINPYHPAGEAASVTLIDVTFKDCTARGGNETTAVKGGKGGGSFASGQDGRSMKNVTGIGMLGVPMKPGYFGVTGASGKYGKRGKAGSGSVFTRHVSGYNGTEGKAGNSGGFGAAGGAGGSGGGGGGGAQETLGSRPGPCGNGGDGKLAGKNGISGFGCRNPNYPRAASSTGSPPHSSGILNCTPGTGGKGGDSYPRFAGAGFGGAVFLMGNASLSIQGSGSMSGGKAIGGSSTDELGKGSGAGAGVFMQGSGKLKYYIDENETYTVSDPIVDESVSINGTVPQSKLENGIDGLPAGGGNGDWQLSKDGSGKLTLEGDHAFSGPITLESGTLDLSRYSNPSRNTLNIKSSAALKLCPSQRGTTLSLNSVNLDADAELFLNGYSQIEANYLNVSKLNVIVDSDGFDKPSSAIKITSAHEMKSKPTVNVSEGYSVSCSLKEIRISKSEKVAT